MELLERDDLLETLHTELAQASGRDGRLVFVGGEAGIGKSALLRAFRHSLPDGSATLIGACDPLSTPRPLGPLLDMAAALPEEVTAPLEAGRRDRVFRALHRYLHSRSDPLVMVVEDVHWADEATLDLLRFLGRRLDGVPALLLASFRDDEVGGEHPLLLLLGDMAASTQTRRLRIPPLTAAAVAELARGSSVDPAELHRVTRGNPFYATEVLAAGGGLPDSVREAVLARVARLPKTARAYLDLAAVIGDRIDLQLLEGTVSAAREGLEAALAHGVLHPVSVTPPITLVFRHELARQALLDAMPLTRRRALHARVLTALEAAGNPAPDRLALLAHHAEGAGDRTAVLRYAPAAARRAGALAAHREAAAQYARALRSADGLPDGERAELLVAFAIAGDTVDRLDEAAAAYREALELYRSLNDREQEGMTMALLVQNLVTSGRNEEAEAVSRASLALLEPRPPGLALVTATTMQALLRMLHRDGAEAVRWSERALALAERLGTEEMVTRATNILGASLVVSGALERGREQLERSLELARASDNHNGVSVALSNLGSALGEWHQFDAADRYLERAIAYGREHDLESNRHYSLSWLALTRLHLGRWDEAAAAAHAVLAQPHAAISQIMALIALGRLRARRGDPDAWGPLDTALALARPTGTLQRLAPVRAARAETAWLTGEPERTVLEARAAYAMAEERSQPWFVGELGYWRWKAGDLEAPPPGAAEPYAMQIAGRSREAATAWRALGCPYEAARALAESADLADRREALRTFVALGAAPILERLRSDLGRTGTASEPDPFVRLLGAPGIRYRGAWHHPPYGKTAAMLYHLAHRGDWVDRGELIVLLWPDVSDRRARASLRNLLSHTARTLPYATGLEIEARRVRWRVPTDLDGVGGGALDDDPAGGNTLLAGFHPPDLPEFEHWLVRERAARDEERRNAALERARYLADSDPAAAAAALDPHLSSDPLDEELLRLALGYLRAAGHGAEALERYRRFHDALRDEVGVEPDPNTVALVADLLPTRG